MIPPRRSVCVLAAVLAACGGGPSTTVPEDPVPTTITISPSSVHFTYLAQSTPLTAQVRDQSGAPMVAPVTWSSDDPSVSVTVNGIVRAVANGSANVQATAGGASASVQVTVQQVASGILIVSGGGQQALAGTTLPDPIVVAARDAAGSPVEGVEIGFTPDPLHGSVSVGSQISGPDGRASTEWTLGPGYGPQRLVVSISGVQSVVNARARADVPTPDLVAVGPVTLLRPDPSSLETMTVRASVRNDGDAATTGGYRVQLLADAVEVGTVDMLDLAPDATTPIEFAVGPFAAGQRALRVVVDPDAAVLELDETNNALDRVAFIVAQTEVAPGSSTSGIGAATDQELLYRVVVPDGPPQTLTVTTSGGVGDVDLFVERTARPSTRTGYDDCISAGPTTVERCQLVLASGTYHILLHAFSTFSGTTMTVTLGGQPAPFDLELVFIDPGTPEQDQAFRDAAARWMSILIGDVPDVDFSSSPLAANTCIDGQEAINGTVDDVRIYVVIEPIDGSLGTLGSAGPCVTRSLSNLPVVGSMRFDEADLERLRLDGDMDALVLHEMGHVLGIGTIWRARDLLRNPSLPSNQGADTYFAGQRARAAFDAAGGTAYMGGDKVPVENQAGPGSGDAHWRESVLDTELMTPFLDGLTANPLSAITVESLADLGYGVDPSRADAYTLPPFPAAVAGVSPSRKKIDLRGDIREGPVVVVDEKGRIVRIR